MWGEIKHISKRATDDGFSEGGAGCYVTQTKVEDDTGLRDVCAFIIGVRAFY